MPIESAFAIKQDNHTLSGVIPEGFDVFGVPHGGFLLALSANAVLTDAQAPDLFSITAHFLRKAEVGPVQFEVREAGRSRRFRSIRAEAKQNNNVIIAISALVGDRDEISGPNWTSKTPWRPTPDDLVEPDVFPRPAVAEKFDLRLSKDSIGFVTGQTEAQAELKAVMNYPKTSQLTALVACDLTPPAIWNKMGLTGWTPTVELTAHVRARPNPGPMTIEATTQFLGGGFLEEDALVYDSIGQLVVQSRQLARHSENTPGARI